MCYRYVLFSNLVLAVPKMGEIFEVGHSPDGIFSYTFAVVLSSLFAKKVAQSYKIFPEAIVSKVGHGLERRQNLSWFQRCTSQIRKKSKNLFKNLKVWESITFGV